MCRSSEPGKLYTIQSTPVPSHVQVLRQGSALLFRLPFSHPCNRRLNVTQYDAPDGALAVKRRLLLFYEPGETRLRSVTFVRGILLSLSLQIRATVPCSGARKACARLMLRGGYLCRS